eukprot:TRINITY_DN229_c2_g2_i3.p1 TRINITY_DN229_c2_g2~~TRINITY_DN229_c2_g2_i3.p1  ORF type:complete len:426 (-),score=168.35 TRINITY_DN229_c2_g2_i3:32-1189(-)
METGMGIGFGGFPSPSYPPPPTYPQAPTTSTTSRGRGGGRGRPGVHPQGGRGGGPTPATATAAAPLVPASLKPLKRDDLLEVTYSLAPIFGNNSGVTVALNLHFKNRTSKTIHQISLKLEESSEIVAADQQLSFSVLPPKKELAGFARHSWTQRLLVTDIVKPEKLVAKIVYVMKEDLKKKKEEKEEEKKEEEKKEEEKGEDEGKKEEEKESEEGAVNPEKKEGEGQEEEKKEDKEDEKEGTEKTKEAVNRELAFNLYTYPSTFVVGQRFDKNKFYGLIRAEAKHTVVHNVSRTTIGQVVSTIRGHFGLFVIEQDPTKASLYGTTVQNNHVVFLVKINPETNRGQGQRSKDAMKDIAVAIKSDSPDLALNLKEELTRLEGLSLSS